MKKNKIGLWQIIRILKNYDSEWKWWKASPEDISNKLDFIKHFFYQKIIISDLIRKHIYRSTRMSKRPLKVRDYNNMVSEIMKRCGFSHYQTKKSAEISVHDGLRVLFDKDGGLHVNILALGRLEKFMKYKEEKDKELAEKTNKSLYRAQLELQNLRFAISQLKKQLKKSR